MQKIAVAFLLKSNSICAKRGPASFLSSRPLATRVSKLASANSQDEEVGALCETFMGPSEIRKALEKKKTPRLKVGKGNSEGSLHTQISTAKAKRRAEAKTTADGYEEDLAAYLVAAENATQLTEGQIVESENAAAEGREELASCAPTGSVQDDLSEIIAKLDLNTCKYGNRWKQTAHKLLDYGIPLTHIILMLKKCRKLTCSVVRVDSTLKHFALLGMSHQAMGRTIARLPTILNVTDSMFRCKIEFFESFGIDKHYLGKNASVTIMAVTTNLSTLRENAAFWNDYMKDVHVNAVRSMVLSNPQILKYKLFQQKLAWLEAQDFDKKWFLKGSPILSLTLPMLISKAEMLEGFGISCARRRAWALKVLARIRISKIQARFDNLLAAGFSLQQAQGIVSRAPSVLSLTEENVNAKICYVLNVVNASLDTLALSGAVWSHCLETRVKNRHEVIKRLRSMEALARDVSLEYMIRMKNVDFNRKFVEKLQDIGKQADPLGA